MGFNITLVERKKEQKVEVQSGVLVTSWFIFSAMDAEEMFLDPRHIHYRVFFLHTFKCLFFNKNQKILAEPHCS